MANTSGLVRDVVERYIPFSSTPPRQPFPNDAGGSSKTGFPAVQHRSKITSAFKRARMDQRMQKDMSASRENSNSITRPDSMKGPKGTEEVMEDVLRSNAEAVERMTEEERWRERQDIRDQLGPGIDDLIKKVRKARAQRADSQATAGQQLLQNCPMLFNDTFCRCIPPRSTCPFFNRYRVLATSLT